ncbi:MAG: arginine--tRNA ligase [Candidatus Kerfeldbacteria bacterium]|nr:arginine--tRNA ligase [Candidatus Kerfeldbacteria bacterium]
MILPVDRLRQLLSESIRRAYPAVGEVEVAIEPAPAERFGHYASSVALKLGPMVKQPPIEVAQHILAQMGKVSILAKAEVASPGFINFWLSPKWLMSYAPKIAADRKFGHNDAGRGGKILVEFISANPTGPMTLGNGRGAFAGDTMSNVLAISGWRVSREFYLNDIGQQVNILAESVIRRYFQFKGIPTEYPDYCYQGEYVTDLAKQLKIDRLKLQDMMTIRDRIKSRILNIMIRDIQRVVAKKLKVEFDRWVRESSLYAEKLDVKVVDELRRHDLLAHKDGALWFRTTAFGDDKDRVLIKKDGEKTYFLSDIALRWDRFAIRGVKREILYLGADHHGYVRRLKAAMAALGFAHQLDAEIVQLVRLIRDGHEVKMSKRAGTYVTLEEVVDEVGLDAARFFFLMHAPNTHMDFDITLAKERSEKNPVYYVQYAGARLAGILKNAASLPVQRSKEPPQPSELRLVKALLYFPTVVAEVAVSHETQKLPFYSLDLATKFHEFYTQCRVIDTGTVWAHRLQLVRVTRQVLERVLGLMGVTCPERM